MTFIHYTEQPFTLDARTYEQKPDNYFKPHGLWLSVEGTEGDQTWKTWCEGEDFRTEGLRQATTFDVDLSRVLVIDDGATLYSLTKQYPGPSVGSYIYPDWSRIADEYAGIVIAPYHSSYRLNNAVFWYYSWDCASACIWDLSVVKEMR